MSRSTLATAKRFEQQPVISVKRSLWRMDDEHAKAGDDAFTQVRAGVLQRDNYTCQHCAWRASRYQEVHHLDNDHHNNSPENLTTLCNLCHQVYHIGMCAERNAGFFAVIPELSQSEINGIARIIHVTPFLANADNKERYPDLNDRMTSIFSIFQQRGVDTIKRAMGDDITLSRLASIISDPTLVDDARYAQRHLWLDGLRLVPTKDAFHAGQLEYYALNHNALFSVSDWIRKAEQMVE